MTIRRLLIAVILLFGGAGASAADAPAGRLDAFVDLPKETPYVGEPLRLVLRSAIRARVASDRIEQPALTDFDWRQFGVDQSSEALIDGFWTPVHTRTLMIYPLRAGRLTIAPFKWRVSYMTGDGERAEVEFVSQPLEIDARARDAVGDAADFWLPAKALRISDHWEPDPDRIPPGETARRIVTVEAEGVTADRLPPLPSFRAPGVITFAGPVERQTIVTDQGPVARAAYQWSVRPVSTMPAVAPAIRLRWFDVSARVMRESAAPERRVAFIGAEREAKPNDASAGFLSARPLIAALLGFVSTSAAAYLVVSSKAGSRSWPSRAKTWRLRRALRAAARREDVAAFRLTLREVAKTEPDLWRLVAARDDIAPALAAIDAAIFAKEAPASIAPLAPLAQKISAALR
jgi:hypothetical protein